MTLLQPAVALAQPNADALALANLDPADVDSLTSLEGSAIARGAVNNAPRVQEHDDVIGDTLDGPGRRLGLGVELRGGL